MALFNIGQALRSGNIAALANGRSQRGV